MDSRPRPALRAPPADPRRSVGPAPDGRLSATSRSPPGGPSPRRSSRCRPETMSLVIDGGASKGDVLGVAELAGVMGGKRTSDLIPLCHPLALTDLVGGDHAGPGRRRPADPGRGRDDRPDRRRDGGDDRRVRRRPDRLRHGQGRRARRRDPGRPAASRRPAARAASGSATTPPGTGDATPERPRPGARAAGRVEPKPAGAAGSKRRLMAAVRASARPWS